MASFTSAHKITAQEARQWLNDMVTPYSVMVASHALDGCYDAALTCEAAMRRLRVFTLQDIADEANRQGFKLTPSGVQIQIGRLCRAMADIMGANEYVEALSAVLAPDMETIHAHLLMEPCRLASAECPENATDFDRIERDTDGHIVYRLRRGLCRV